MSFALPFRYYSSRKKMIPQSNVFIFILGNLIFNPVTYQLLKSNSWRMTYVIYAGVLFVIGLACALTFKPPTDTQLESKGNTVKNKEEYESMKESSAQNNVSGETENIPLNNLSESTPFGNYTKLNDTQKNEEVIIANRTKVIMSAIWLLASTMKCLAYFTPLHTLVSKLYLNTISFVM